ncbi:Zinc finger, PMZ-type [Corchorus capsularis]|uniref:Protein FAR1-RELATED SEQUENCE n=1 Tax=Corchorus capsularis TaxID=210143 RepID=A0A1R3IQE9_COCAP|nr:Zinc finger, PMZ-type [Corchorus capsularis]
MSKLTKKLNGYTDYEEIKQVLQTVVYDSSTESEFENGWSLMIDTYNLTDNEWLGGLYRERQRWVPAYVKCSFWAGMSTTQRSESINAFFKGYVSHKTTLKQFVELYDVALKSKVEKENLADYESFNSWYACLSHYDIEKQFQRVYTNAKFKEFQDELKGKFYCHPYLMKTENLIYEYKSKVEKENLADYESFNSWYACLSHYDIEKQFQRVYTNAKFKEFQDELKGKFYCHPYLMKTENLIYEYKVVEDVQVGEKRKDVAFLVQFNEVDFEVNCQCLLFEFRGILCRHALSVLIDRKVNEVPQKYILSRWKKDLKRRYNFIKSSYNPLRLQTERYERMTKEFQKVIVLAADSEDKYELVLKGIEELKIKVASDELIDNQTIKRPASPSQSCADNRVPSRTNKVLSPLVTRRRGRPSTKRKIPRIEEVIRKLKNKKKVQQVKENIGSKKSRTKKNLQQRKEVEQCEGTCLSSQNCTKMQSLESFNLTESRTAGEYCMFTPSNLRATSNYTNFEGNQAPLLGGYYPPTHFAPNIYHSSQESVIGFQDYFNQSGSGVYGGSQQTISNRNWPQENPYTFESNKDQRPKM